MTQSDWYLTALWILYPICPHPLNLMETETETETIPLFGYFWKSQVKTQKILELLKLVKNVLIFFGSQERNSEIKAIRNNLEMYNNSKIIEKRGFLTTLIVKCDTLYEHIIESKNNFHTAIGKYDFD